MQRDGVVCRLIDYKNLNDEERKQTLNVKGFERERRRGVNCVYSFLGFNQNEYTKLTKITLT